MHGCNNRGVKTAPKPPLPPLQDALDRITGNTRALVQAERLAVSEQASEELFESGIEDRILRAGASMPEFTLPDALTGKPVCSADLLALGPLVVKFFRGRWCPYCVTELERWRDLHDELRAMGAFLVAISPQTPRQNDFTLQQHRAAVSHSFGRGRGAGGTIWHCLHRAGGASPTTTRGFWSTFRSSTPAAPMRMRAKRAGGCRCPRSSW